MARVLCIIALIFSLSHYQVQAQPVNGLGEGGAASTRLGPRKQLATIIFSGLGGAILGLSTLPFYGRPQDKLANIAVGFAVGVIGGTVYTTYKTATRPYRGVKQEPFGGQKHPVTAARSPLRLSYSFDF